MGASLFFLPNVDSRLMFLGKLGREAKNSSLAGGFGKPEQTRRELVASPNVRRSLRFKLEVRFDMNRLDRFRLHHAWFIVFLVFCSAAVCGNAWAQFEARAALPLPPGAFSVAAGDFNNDGKLDIVVTDDGGFSVSLGNGDGTFQKPVFHATQLSYSLAVADFNGDGNLDIVVANENLNPSTVSVYLGNGDGTFRAPINSPTTAANEFVAVGDFNGDHKVDIVVIDSPYISILLGNGDGTFKQPTDNSSFIGPQSLAVGDFNSDRKLDVVVVGFFGGSTNLAVLLGNGDGSLQDALNHPLSLEPSSVSVGDFNRDGKLDAVVADKDLNITVFLGDGNGGFGSPKNYDTTGLSGGPVVVADLNKDGKLDLAVQTASGSVGGVDVFWGLGDGTFEQAQFFGTAESGLPVMGDFNNDSWLDLVMVNALWATTALNTGSADFSPSAPLSFGLRLAGTTSPSRILKLTNLGADAMTIRSVTVSGPFQATNTCGGQLSAGSSCTFNVTFSPSRAGAQSGTITLVDSASSKPQVVELTGTGTFIEALPTSINFGSQKVGTTSGARHIAVTNTGSDAVTYNSVSVQGKNASDFSETDNCTGRSIPPDGVCQINVTFTPNKMGERTAEVEVTPKSTTAPAPVELTGTGN